MEDNCTIPIAYDEGNYAYLNLVSKLNVYKLHFNNF